MIRDAPKAILFFQNQDNDSVVKSGLTGLKQGYTYSIMWFTVSSEIDTDSLEANLDVLYALQIFCVLADAVQS